MRKLHILTLILAALLTGACVYDFTTDLAGDEGILVVEGDILIGDLTTIRLSRSIKLSGSDQVDRVPGACYVEASDGTRYGNGSPVIDTRNADPLLEYRLLIETGGRRYASEWAPVLPAAPIDSLSFSISADRTTMTVEVSTHGSAENRYYRWIAEETWEYHAPFQASHYFVQSGRMLNGERAARDTVAQYENGENSYFCWSSALVKDVMVASTDQLSENRLVRQPLYRMNCYEERISYYYSVLLKQECISETAYRYWTMLDRNSTDVGGLFSPEPYEMRGNVFNEDDPSEMVLGYISVSSPASTRYFIQSSKMMFPKTHRSDYDFEPVYVQKTEWRNYYRSGYDVYMIHTDEAAGSGIESADDYEFDWLPARCVKCWLSGSGSKAKPDWWPNDHK
ncbi:MAG: DUF4249 domain-containing protein [Bacteroidales bacterium]|nr:DUF4249 domain-containing protein [Bacteroidales bacterium]